MDGGYNRNERAPAILGTSGDGCIAAILASFVVGHYIHPIQALDGSGSCRRRRPPLVALADIEHILNWGHDLSSGRCSVPSRDRVAEDDIRRLDMMDTGWNWVYARKYFAEAEGSANSGH